jgi:hypothetical protein
MRHKRTILLVEDNLDNVFLMEHGVQESRSAEHLITGGKGRRSSNRFPKEI